MPSLLLLLSSLASTVDEDGYDTLWASLLCWNRDDIWNGGRKEERRRLNSYFI